MNWDQQLRQEYQDRWIWVTGAAQGIGQSIAQSFTALGAKVIGFDRRFDSQPEYLAKTVICDLNDLNTLKARLKELLSQGLAPYNLINVAGVLELDNLEALNLEQWQHCQQVNSGAVFCFINACISHFKQQKVGSIITVGSNAAHTPRQQMAAYCASKAAVTQLTMTAGLELANYGVRCNVIAPGSTLTPMQTGMWQDENGSNKVIAGFPEQYKLGIPLQKLATAQEIANSVVFFASNLASHTTMQVVTVDGGATI